MPLHSHTTWSDVKMGFLQMFCDTAYAGRNLDRIIFYKGADYLMLPMISTYVLAIIIKWRLFQ